METISPVNNKIKIMFQMINAVVVEKLNEIKFEFKFKCVYDNNLSFNLFINDKNR